MHEQSLGSISFVISAAYTFTFANAIFFMVAIDPNKPFGIENIEFNLERLMCAVICMVMTLRYFFGNNQYIYDVMNSNKNPWVKFYHFLFIALQSVILLISSYFIPDTNIFIWTILILFGVELFWYLLTFIVDREGVWPNDQNKRIDFLIAETYNFVFFAGVIILTCVIDDSNLKLISLVFMLFLINTIYDLKKNMSSYMGSS